MTGFNAQYQQKKCKWPPIFPVNLHVKFFHINVSNWSIINVTLGVKPPLDAEGGGGGGGGNISSHV